MADAPIQLDLFEAAIVASLSADIPAGSALRRRRGGTGFSVETLAELQAELGIVAAPSTMGAATSIAGASGGITPNSAAGDQARALVGAAVFSVLLEIQKILDASGTPLVDFEGLGDMLNRLYLAAAASGGQKARIGARGADENIDLQTEPKNGGDLTVWASPIEDLIRPTCGIFAQSDAAGFQARSLAAPIVESFDTAGAPNSPVLLRDADGFYVQVSTDDVTGSTCGFSFSAACTQRQAVPTFYWFGNAQFIDTRAWFAACLSDPVNATDLVSLPNPGVALWIDQVIHSAPKSLRLITCSGPAINISQTGKFSVDSSGRLDRNDGGDWIADGIRLDDVVTVGGFTINPSNNGARRVVSFVPAGTPKRRIVFDTPMIPEVTPAGAVTVTHPGQVQSDTGYVVGANARFGFRLRYLPTSFQWEFMAYNFATKAWESRSVSDGVAPVPADALLSMFWRQRVLTNAQHKTACASMFYRRRT
jgi:hypothetical protein